MYCERCGTQLPDNARFCPRCGKKVSAGAAPSPVRAAGRPGPKEEVLGGAAARAPKIPDPQVKRKIIAVVLTLAALALMATNWVTAAGEARHELTSIWNTADSALGSLENTVAWITDDLDLGPLREDISRAMDGRYTPFEIFSAGQDLLPVIQDIRDALAWFGETEADSMLLLLGVMIGVFMCLAAASAISGCIAVFMHIFGRKGRAGGLFFAMLLLLFLYITLICCWLLIDEAALIIRPTVTSLAAVILAGVASRPYDRNQQEPVAAEADTGAEG